MADPKHRGLRLDPEDLRRYGRHLVLPDVGMEGQLRLRSGAVLIVGAGGLGSPVATYLAAAGVGRLGLVDFDRVELSNLQRQVLFGTRDLGRPKVAAARDRLCEINPQVTVEIHDEHLSAANARSLLSRYDVIVDGTDNFPTRYLVNDACVLLGKPNVYGSVFRFEGQVSVFWASRGPCYRCLYPEPPAAGVLPNCAEGGVLGVLPGTIGTLQATEAIKLLIGKGQSLLGRLLLFDALEMRFRELELRRDPDCPVCGEHPTIRELKETGESCAPGHAGTEQDAAPEITVRDLDRRVRAGDTPELLDVRTAPESEICRLSGAHLIPLHELAGRFDELDPRREIVVYCHVGLRSAIAVAMLRRRGFDKALNLSGGIDAWAEEVDPGMPRY